MRSLEQIVAEGKQVAANRDALVVAGKTASEEQRVELRKHWKQAENKVRELQAEYVAAKQAVPPGELSVRDKEWALHGFRVATIRVAQAAQLPKNQRNKALGELVEAMWRECHEYEAKLKAIKEAE